MMGKVMFEEEVGGPDLAVRVDAPLHPLREIFH